jgi:oligopeptide transport system substrate-binding protein
MRVSARGMGIVGMSGLALVLSACGVLGGDDEGEAGGYTGAASGAISVGGCNPQNPLIPINTNEVCGGNPLDAIFSMLVRYDADTGEGYYEVAASIESEDNQVWTIELKPGWTFHDGSPITASSFVDAWNWGVQGANSDMALNQYFFQPIEGYAEQRGEFDADGNYIEGSGTEEMSGLEVVNDLTFRVTLSNPESGFPQRLGYPAFAPLPESFYEDPEAFGEHPVGSGPFELVDWTRESHIRLAAYEGYQGENRPRVEEVTFQIYQQREAEYADLLADNVDVMTQLPASALTGEQYKSDLGDRFIERETGVIHTIAFPPESVDPDYADPNLRKAISMSINRQLIIDNIFQGVREAATGWVSPVVDGFVPDQCGEACEYNPERARALLAESGFDGTLTLSYNADGDHKPWIDATCNSIKNALEIDCQGVSVALFSEFRETIVAREMEGMFRTGWQMDYPSIENFLVPLYATGASANDGDYSNEEVDDLFMQAAQQDAEAALATYQQAERLMAEDMPTIPLWYGKTVAGYSSAVDNVHITPFQTLDLLSITRR